MSDHSIIVLCTIGSFIRFCTDLQSSATPSFLSYRFGRQAREISPRPDKIKNLCRFTLNIKTHRAFTKSSTFQKLVGVLIDLIPKVGGVANQYFCRTPLPLEATEVITNWSWIFQSRKFFLALSVTGPSLESWFENWVLPQWKLREPTCWDTKNQLVMTLRF